MFNPTLVAVFAIAFGMVHAAPTAPAGSWQMPKGFPNITYVGLSAGGYYYDFNVTFTMGSMYGMGVSWNISDILPNWARRADKYDVYNSLLVNLGGQNGIWDRTTSKTKSVFRQSPMELFNLLSVLPSKFIQYIYVFL